MPRAMPTMRQGPPKAPNSSGAKLAPNAAALGADLVDNQKTKTKNLKRSVAHLPIVCVDVFGGDNCSVSYQPPGVVLETKTLKSGKKKVVERPVSGAVPQSVGCLKNRGDLVLKANDDAAHKAVRRMLKGNLGAMEKVLASAVCSNEEASVTLARPANLLGARSISSVHSSILSNYTHSTKKDHAEAGVAVSIKEQALDGTEATGDDFDRVAFDVKMHSDKSSLALLPEEALSVLIAEAKYMVKAKLDADNIAEKKGNDNSGDDAVDDEPTENYPVAVALPGWCGDAAIEAAIEAFGARESVVFKRGICALASAMMNQSLHSKLQKELKDLSENGKGSSAQNAKEQPLLLVAGLTPEGVELHFIQTGKTQASRLSPFGVFNSIVSNCFQSSMPLSNLPSAFDVLCDNLEAILPGRQPCAILTYGSEALQKELAAELEKLAAKRGWSTGSCVSSREDAVSAGACAFVAHEHGRLDDDFLKAKYVSTCAVGIRCNYFGDDDSRKRDGIVQTIFDFDRKVPTSQYSIEFSSAECACVRSKDGSDDYNMEDVKAFEGAKYVPVREEAAKALRVQIVQKFQRGGEWVNVGDEIKPLCMEGDNEGELIGCEEITLKLILASSGLITNSLEGDRQSVVHAVKEAEKNKFWYYASIIGAILFFGGFMLKSWYGEVTFEKNTKKLLAYYNHVLPESLAADDKRQAQYLVWKYSNNIDLLWRRLEAKYGVPVPDSWPDDEDDEEENGEEHIVDMDDEESTNNLDEQDSEL